MMAFDERLVKECENVGRPIGQNGKLNIFLLDLNYLITGHEPPLQECHSFRQFDRDIGVGGI